MQSSSNPDRLLCALALGLYVVLGAPAAAQNEDLDASGGKSGKTQDYSPFPAPDSGYVTDAAGLLDQSDEERIEQWLWDIEEQTGVEIIVVTLERIEDYPGTPNDSIEDFATALFNRYGIGNMPENDGVLLLVARFDRKARIELGAGYSEARDDDAAHIMGSVIVPAFREARYSDGIVDGVRAISAEFAEVRIGPNWLLIGMIAAIPVLVLVAISLFRSGKKGWGWIVVGLILILVLAIIYMIVMAARKTSRSNSSSWNSGGLGGFGGGSSAGGGATGDW